MPVEKASYRDNLELIIKEFPNKKMLCVSDVVRFTGLYRSTVTKKFPFKDNYISIAVLAREMSG